MEYFPIFIDIRDKPVLVIGQYRVLEFKIEKMIEAGAKIRYLADFLPGKLEKHVKSGKVSFLKEKYENKHLTDVWLVVCGSDDTQLKARIEKDTAEKKILCNFVDEAPISSFISPSVIARGDLTIAISTKGKSPALNKYLKKEIVSKIGEEYVHFTEILGKMRDRVIKHIPGQKQRADLFDSIVQNPDVQILIKQNKYEEAQDLVKDLIEIGIRKISTKEN